MELPDVPAWLATTSAAGRRLRAVTLDMAMPPQDRQLGASLTALVLAVGQTFPNLRSLSVDGLAREESKEEPPTAFFQALGKHLPNITTLCVRLNDDADYSHLDIPGVNWAACLPAGLRKIELNVDLHPALLQHLARMPNLTEIEAYGLSMNMGGDDQSTVQSEACAWRVLRLVRFPAYQDVCRFSTWPHFSLQNSTSGDTDFSWSLGQHSPEQTLATATAAARLATSTNIDMAWFDSGFTIGGNDLPTKEFASAVGVISALAPLADKLQTLCLENWTISATLLDELAQALPNTHTLELRHCIITGEAWVRLLTLTSVTRLSISAQGPFYPPASWPRLTLHEATVFSASVPRAMTLSLSSAALKAGDVAAWDIFLESLEMRRMALGLPPLTIVPYRRY